MAKTQDAPLCVSDYEAGESECDGNPEAKTARGKAPCGWRDRCVGLQCYLVETDKVIDDFVDFVVKDVPVEYEDPESGEVWTKQEQKECTVPRMPKAKFDALCDKQVQRYGVKHGKVTKDPVGDPPPKPVKEKQPDRRKFTKPTKRAQRAAKAALHRRKAERRALLQKLFRYFMLSLEAALDGTGHVFNRPGCGIAAGELYLVNRLDSSGYISVYCKHPLGRDPAVALAKFKPRDLTLEILTPFEVEDFSGAARKNLRLQPVDGGQFKSAAMNLDKEGVALAAETIAAMVQSGKIALPEAAP